jgi:hypothetical protein
MVEILHMFLRLGQSIHLGGLDFSYLSAGSVNNSFYTIPKI